MDPYVLALQLYLFNKACGGLPLRIAEQVVVTSVVNATCWTARTIGSGVMWLARPATQVQPHTQKSTTRDIFKDQHLGHHPNSEREVDTSSKDLDLDLEFEIITPEQINELEK
jgi:hypothetical protein